EGGASEELRALRARLDPHVRQAWVIGEERPAGREIEKALARRHGVVVHAEPEWNPEAPRTQVAIDREASDQPECLPGAEDRSVLGRAERVVRVHQREPG